MGDRTIHIEPVVDWQSLGKLRNTLSQVKLGEQVTIVMEAADAHQSDRVTDLLKKEGFDYQARGTHDGSRYQVIAKRLQ